MKSRSLIVTLLGSVALLASACSGKTEDPAAAKSAVAAENTEAKPSAAAEPVKLEAKAAQAAAQAGAGDQGDHAGCIYAEGEKGTDEAACPHGPGEAGAPAAGDGHFGSPFQLAQALPLSEAIAKKPDGTVQVQGTVEAVCQKKGCWMVIKDGTESARVLMKDHGFAVPMDSRGKPVVVEGTLASRTFSEEQVKHLEKDAGKDPGAVSGTRTEHVLTASAVQIKS